MRPLDMSPLEAFKTPVSLRRRYMLLGAFVGMVLLRVLSVGELLPRVDILLVGSIASLTLALVGLCVGIWGQRRSLRTMLAPNSAVTLSQVMARAGARVRVRGTLGPAVTTPALRPLFRLRLKDGDVLVDESSVLAIGEENGAKFSEGDEIVVDGDCNLRPVHDDYRGQSQQIVIGGVDGIQVARAR